jgi:glucans biosynthesis protein
VFNFCLIIYVLIAFVSPAEAKRPFGFQVVQKIAQDLSLKPYRQQDDNLSESLKNMGYDQWRDIRFNKLKTVWAQEKEPFRLQFFHNGFNYKQSVKIHLIDEKGNVSDYPFSVDLFNYGQTNFDKISKKAGFAGFRIHYPLNTPTYADELVAFLGASYFRALPKGLVYGASARGLAVNTGTDSGEEFPFFTEFWIAKPKPKDNQIRVYALLDSPSVSGAYEYDITPGVDTVMDVKSTLYIRQAIEKLGIAPLTSMFYYGENTKDVCQNDFRPEVHDSDGLLIESRSGEWIWRPLDNPSKLRINSFFVGTPKSFALLQRDDHYDHYQDLETRYEIRPSVWVSIDNDWGNGHVELIQIPAQNEYNDNINAFWIPEKALQPHDVLNFNYQLHWSQGKVTPLGYVTSTKIIRQNNIAKFLIEFEGELLMPIPAEKVLNADINVSNGYKITNFQLYKNVVTGGWRLLFNMEVNKDNPLHEVIPGTKPAAELRAFIRDKDKVLTETWTYTLGL